MDIPKYNKHDLEMVPKTGEHELTEFDQYIQELSTSDLLNHPAAVGVVSQVAEQGTADLTTAQLRVLEIATKQFPIEHCIRCGEVIVVKAGEEPGYCESCQDFIETQ